MIGLDTNIILRYLLQDDPKQRRQVNHVIDRQLSDGNPGFISLVTVLEVSREPPLKLQPIWGSFSRPTP